MGFFKNHLWLSTTFRISSTTSLEDILLYFCNVADVRIMTSDLEAAHYITSQPIAHGGLADIYCATLANGSKVAVKRLRQRLESENKELKRTARELDTWAKLDHPNILMLLGLAEYQGQLSMVSRWMELGSVVSFVKNFPNADRFSLCYELVTAVAYLHGVNVVHGDIKGVNALLDENGFLKLTDFGMSIMHDQAMRFSESDAGGGTTRWMAPELFAEEGVRCRETDVYAMGMTMMEIATGRVPFSEIRFGPAVTVAVSRDKRIPQVPELQTASASPKETHMLNIMLSCWKYQPLDRITAEMAQALMASLGPTFMNHGR
ncbi:kinase-like protein [Ceratobasidium sp. AG-I]|nr:kinase-like protein [Ceratobasidium sp. AG-I]